VDTYRELHCGMIILPGIIASQLSVEPGAVLSFGAGLRIPSVGHNTTNNPRTEVFNVGTGTAVVWLAITSPATNQRSGGAPTFGGTEMTQALEFTAASSERGIELWYLLDPVTGNQTLSIPNAGAVSINGVVASAGTDTGFVANHISTNSATGTSTDPSASSPAGEAADELIFAALFDADDNFVASDRTGTSISEDDAGTNFTAAQYVASDSASAKTVGWTGGVSANWVIGASRFKTSLQSNPQPTPTVLYYPGHYVRPYLKLTDNTSDLSEIARLKGIAPGLTGVVPRFTWSGIEVTNNSWNLAPMGAYLDACEDQGLKAIIYVRDRTYTTNETYYNPVVPADLTSLQHICDNTATPVGYCAIRWHPTIIARQKAMVQKIIDVYGNHAALVGISPMEETAHGFSTATRNATGYSAALYRDSIIDLFSYCMDAAPHLSFHLDFNYISNGQAEIINIANALKGNGQFALNTPDILFNNANLIPNVYNYFDQLAGTLPLGASCENDSYNETGYVMQDYLDFASTHHCNFVWWNDNSFLVADKKFDPDAAAVINAHPSWTPSSPYYAP